VSPAELVREYRANPNAAEIARQAGMNPNTVRRWLNRMGIDTGRGRHLSALGRRDVRRLLGMYSAGLTCRDLAALECVSVSTIHRFLLEHGAEMHRRNHASVEVAESRARTLARLGLDEQLQPFGKNIA
jgi:IS30 family transposase